MKYPFMGKPTLSGKYHFIVEKGKIRTFAARWKDSAGDPVDLTGWKAKMQIKEVQSDTVPLLELTTDNGKIPELDETGVVLVTITTADSLLLTEDCVYDLQLEDLTQEDHPFLIGEIRVIPEITSV